MPTEGHQSSHTIASARKSIVGTEEIVIMGGYDEPLSVPSPPPLFIALPYHSLLE